MSRLQLPLALLILTSWAWAAAVQIDVSSTFDSDVIVNHGQALDVIQDPVDLVSHVPGGPASYCLLTQTAANLLTTGTPDGLPDDGIFPAATFNPDVQLQYCNGDDGLNARRLTSVGQSLSFPVPQDSYTELHVFMTTGSGVATVQITLLYTDLTADTFPGLQVPDWFHDPVDTSALYHLIDGLDRVRPDGLSGYQDSNNPAIFGLRVDPDPVKVLDQVTIDYISASAAGAIPNFFGATGVSPTAPPTPLARPGLATSALVVSPGTTISPGTTFDVDVTVDSTAATPLTVPVDLFMGPVEPLPLLPAVGALSTTITVPAGGSAVASFIGIAAPAQPEVWRLHAVTNADLAIPECEVADNTLSESLCFADTGCGPTCGDCDESGAVPATILDALRAAQISAGMMGASLNQQCVCDVNSSGAIEILDALLIAQSAAGLPVSLTCGSGGTSDIALGLAPPTPAEPIVLEFDLCGPPLLDLTFEFTTDAGVTWSPAQPSGTSPLPSPAPGLAAGTHVFEWDSQTDVPLAARPVQAEVRLTALDPVTASTASETTPVIDLLGGTCTGTVEGDLSGQPLPATVSDTTAGADDTLMVTCGSGGGADHIYRFAPATSAQHTFSLCGSSYDTVIEVREQDCQVGLVLACNDDSCGLQSQVSIPVVAGTPYWIIVDSYSGATGTYTLTITSP